MATVAGVGKKLGGWPLPAVGGRPRTARGPNQDGLPQSDSEDT